MTARRAQAPGSAGRAASRLAQAPGSAGRAASHFRGGEGPPLVLIHGYANTWRVWEPVLPALTERHDVLAPTLCGHSDGEPLPEGVEATVGALTDGVERRGRARSVNCLAPAGGWERRSRAERRLRRLFTIGHHLNDRILPYAKRLLRRPRLRKLMFRDAMRHPERLTPAQAAARMEAMAHCTVYWELLATITRDGPPDWLGEVDAPTLVAWPEFDRILPQKGHSEPFRELVRGAEWRILPRRAHVPMACH